MWTNSPPWAFSSCAQKIKIVPKYSLDLLFCPLLHSLHWLVPVVHPHLLSGLGQGLLVSVLGVVEGIF